MYFMRNKSYMIGMVITTYFLRWPLQVLQSQSCYINHNINIYAVFICGCIYIQCVWEYKIWSQVLMKEERLKAITGVCWLLLNTFHAIHELCCLKISIFFLDSGLIWCSTSWVIQACYAVCWLTALEIGTCGCIKWNKHFFSWTECSIERISIITREYQWMRLVST
jgi:hypothetical protein